MTGGTPPKQVATASFRAKSQKNGKPRPRVPVKCAGSRILNKPGSRTANPLCRPKYFQIGPPFPHQPPCRRDGGRCIGGNCGNPPIMAGGIFLLMPADGECRRPMLAGPVHHQRVGENLRRLRARLSIQQRRTFAEFWFQYKTRRPSFCSSRPGVRARFAAVGAAVQHDPNGRASKPGLFELLSQLRSEW